MSTETTNTTWGEIAWGELRTIGEAQGLEAETLDAWASIYRDVASPAAWWSRSTRASALPSGTSHGRPFSAALPISSGPPELRFFIEAQSDPATPADYWSAGWDITRAMTRHGAELERLDAVAELFAPSAPRAPFRVWHRGVLRPGAPPRFTIDLCPAAQGPDHALGHLRDALSRLDMRPALDAILPVMRPGDTVSILSLDLSDAPDAGLRLYLMQRDAHLDHMARAVALGADDPEQAEAEARDVALSLLPGCDQTPLFWLSCHHFSPTDPANPLYSTAHIAVGRQAADDAELELRVAQLARELGLDPRAYLRARAALPTFAANHESVSWQRVDGEPELAIHFAPRPEHG